MPELYSEESAEDSSSYCIEELMDVRSNLKAAKAYTLNSVDWGFERKRWSPFTVPS